MKKCPHCAEEIQDEAVIGVIRESLQAETGVGEMTGTVELTHFYE